MTTGSRHQPTRTVLRLGTATTTVAAALLVSPGSAVAGTDSVVSGDCTATVRGTDGKPLAIGANAVVGEGGLELGLGTRSDSTLSLPVEETVEILGLDDAGAASETAETVCESGQETVNTLTDPTQEQEPTDEQLQNADSDDTQSGDSGDGNKNSSDGVDISPSEHTRPTSNSPAGTTHGAGAPSIAAGGAGATDRSPSSSTAPQPSHRDETALPRNTRSAPVPSAQGHSVAHSPAGEMDPLDRLPLLLAVGFLALVATTLTHTWMRRRETMPK